MLSEPVAFLSLWIFIAWFTSSLLIAGPLSFIFSVESGGVFGVLSLKISSTYSFHLWSLSFIPMMISLFLLQSASSSFFRVD